MKADKAKHEIQLRLSKKDEELNNTRVIHSKALWSMQAYLNVETKFKANSAKKKVN